MKQFIITLLAVIGVLAVAVCLQPVDDRTNPAALSKLFCPCQHTAQLHSDREKSEAQQPILPDLAPGEYRITKEILYRPNGQEDYSSFEIYADFVVSEAK